MNLIDRLNDDAVKWDRVTGGISGPATAALLREAASALALDGSAFVYDERMRCREVVTRVWNELVRKERLLPGSPQESIIGDILTGIDNGSRL